jgi:sirohydrochlorin ferrochelatase
MAEGLIFQLNFLIPVFCSVATHAPRSNPRLVKKTRSKFPSKKPVHRGTGTQRQPLNLFIINSA